MTVKFKPSGPNRFIVTVPSGHIAGFMQYESSKRKKGNFTLNTTPERDIDISACEDMDAAKVAVAKIAREEFWYEYAPLPDFEPMSRWWERACEAVGVAPVDAFEMTFNLDGKPQHFIDQTYALIECWDGVQTMRDFGYSFSEGHMAWRLVYSDGSTTYATFDWKRKRWTITRYDAPVNGYAAEDWKCKGLLGRELRNVLETIARR